VIDSVNVGDDWMAEIHAAETDLESLQRKREIQFAFLLSFHFNSKYFLLPLSHCREYFRLTIISIIFAIPTIFFGMIVMLYEDLKMALHLMDGIPILFLYLIDKTGSFYVIEIVPGFTIEALVMWILATPMQFYVGKFLYVKAFKSLRSGSPTMEVLITLGTSVAYFGSVVRPCRSHLHGATDLYYRLVYYLLQYCRAYLQIGSLF